MPKIASKRARARREARVVRAHHTTLDRPITRRVPAAKQRRPRGFAGFIARYPWASTIFTVLVVGGLVGVLYVNHVGPFAPPPVHPCNLKTHVCQKPAVTIDKHKLYVATVKTSIGTIVINLDAQNAPLATNNFVYLANQHFYDGLTFWRIEQKGKPSGLDPSTTSTLDLIQGGDPLGNGRGGPGYSFNDDPVVGDYVAGAVAMANSGANTNGSQFFICTADDSSALAKSYSLFGHVVSGLDIAQKMTKSDKILGITIVVENLPTPTPGNGATPSPTSQGATPSPTK
jgi:cyclophilin family peptidyl-prolyl cis-trans isomerase